MPKRFYPAVVERGEHGAVGVWFPDFPGCVAAGRTQDEALERAGDVLEDAMRGCAERDAPLPDPAAMEDVRPPKGCDLICIAAIGGTPPDPSERVNVYLPKSLIERVDRAAAELGMNRSSFFGMAAHHMLRLNAPVIGTFGPGWETERKRGRR